MPVSRSRKPANQPAASRTRATSGPGADKVVVERVGRLPAAAAQLDPDMPVEVATLEAERCHQAAARLRPKLVRLPGFDVRDLDHMPLLSRALTQVERTWQLGRADLRLRSKKPMRKEAELLRAQFVASGRYLFRGDASALSEIERISQGQGVADLVQDLADMPAHLAAHAAVWKQDVHLPADAARRMNQYHAELAALADSEAAVSAREQRNRLFWALDACVTQVREAARYLLRNDRARLQPLLSQYDAQRQRRSRVARRVAAAASQPVEG